MKLKFKKQAYQENAVKAVVDCFAGQPNTSSLIYRVDPGREGAGQVEMYSTFDGAGFKNSDIVNLETVFDNIQSIQQDQNLNQSTELVKHNSPCPVNLDIEMETGTGKTYVYIKTMFELNKQYGWSKFIIVVPSIAIREGVQKSIDITSEHFVEEYGKRVKSFIYNSKYPEGIQSFSTDSGINVMIINAQAFNATTSQNSKDARRIYTELDAFNSRRPIDVIKANKPILILDEPQKLEGSIRSPSNTIKALKEFNPLFILRYSATHLISYNKVHRLDAVDAYNQKLVKKINVRGITVKGMGGISAHLHLHLIEVSNVRPPVAKLEIQVKQSNGVRENVTRKINQGTNLYDLSNKLGVYKDGYIVSEIDANTNTVTFLNGVVVEAGKPEGDVSDPILRRIQIRETIRAHFEKERLLFSQGIKVLSLFFIDEVAKYRDYDAEDKKGEYARVFEEEYQKYLNNPELNFDDSYQNYLNNIDVKKTHNGYFSVDKKGRSVNSKLSGRGTEKTCDDVDAYDLILRKKETLLSFDEPTRFIFSHSALREGWDNPNVFVICTLKKSDNTVTKRQEVGRGLRIAVNQQGERQDNPATVHQINVLTVIANESYGQFVKDLQKEISETLSDRPKVANAEYFKNKILQTTDEKIMVGEDRAEGIEFYLVQNGYVDRKRSITQKYHDDKKNDTLVELPEDLIKYEDQVFRLIDSVFSEYQMPEIENDRAAKTNKVNVFN